MTTKCATATALLWGIGIALLPQTSSAQVFTVRASDPCA
jgi:hypothetical protein